MGVSYSFGAYAYEPAADGDSGSVILDAPVEMSNRALVAESPGSRTSYTDGALPAPQRKTVSGHLFARGADVLADLWDTFVAAHAPGMPLPLYADRNDRYLLAQVDAIKDVDAKNSVGSVGWEVTFLCQDPLWWGSTLHTVPAVVAGGGTTATAGLAVGGSAPARGIITLTIGAIGAIPAGKPWPLTTSQITITNAATGFSMVVWARMTAGTLVIDCGGETITQNGADADAVQLSGEWMDLLPGMTNTLTFTCAGGAQITAAVTSWQDRIW